MGATMKLNPDIKTRPTQEGFTLIEVMISIVVMTIGIFAVILSITNALAHTQSAQEDLIARHKALEALESIYTARNSQQIPFASINNTGSGGIFVSGAQSLLCAGPDGLVGTADDTSCTTMGGVTCPNGGAECWVLPGADGILGNGDDVTYSLANFKRTIAITPVLLSTGVVNSNMRAVTVTVTYTKAGLPARSYSVNGLISSYN
jgi:prepilin-type N-terminal cleavage/methylation domain-containing protein